MKRRSILAVVFDSIFAALCAFAIIFTAVRFYTKNPALGLGLGIAAFVLFGALAFVRLCSKRGRAITFGKNQGRRQAFKTYLCSLNTKAAAALLLPALGGQATQKGIESGEVLYILHFTPQPLSPNDMCGAIATDTQLKKVVLCNSATEDGVKFANLFGVDVLFADGMYEQLEKQNALPEKYPFGDAIKPKFKDKLKGAMKRENAKRLFWCGLWLTAFSYFTFFPIYYIISGGVLLILAAICLVFGKRD